MVRKRNFVEKFYLHYNKDDGKITASSNELPCNSDSVFEVQYEDHKAFVEGTKSMHDYIIGYIKSIDGKTQKALIQVNEQLYGFRTNMFEWINTPPTKNTELIVTWNKKDQTWTLSLTDQARLRLESEPKGKTVFFVMLKDDFDFLIRDIVVDVEDLIKEDLTFPFVSNLEKDIKQISLSSKIYFQSYGLVIND